MPEISKRSELETRIIDHLRLGFWMSTGALACNLGLTQSELEPAIEALYWRSCGSRDIPGMLRSSHNGAWWYRLRRL